MRVKINWLEAGDLHQRSYTMTAEPAIGPSGELIFYPECYASWPNEDSVGHIVLAPGSWLRWEIESA